MLYLSSRGNTSKVDAASAIKMGIAPDGGLFVPEKIPTLNKEMLNYMQNLTYQQRAIYILSLFLPNFTQEEIESCVRNAYNEHNFDDARIAPLVQINNKLHILELWHGPTSAFKDMALQILPYLLTVSAEKTGEHSEILILVATSGDTGKAALEGFKDVKQTKIIVFYPAHGVSEVQKLQMITQEGNNVFVAAVQGNFDDAQNGVKEIFGDKEINELLAANNIKMSSANSINWGRLLPQIVYYISAYVDLQKDGLVADGQPVNIVVPTGNFGNILAAYYAGQMGVPINKLICASNSNNVLTDFIRTGIYNRNRKFEKTISPSMDILISSNLERLLFEISRHDSNRVNKWMYELKTEGLYEVDDDIKKRIKDIFWADYCSDEDTINTIANTWNKDKYLLDTHTAVAMNVYEKYIKLTQDNTVTVIASTASPFKFGGSVAKAVLSEDKLTNHDEFEILKKLADEVGISVPEGIRNLSSKEIRHKTITAKERMKETVLDFLGLNK